MLIGVYVEIAPSGAAGHAEELPGCVVDGPDVDVVLARMPTAIADFCDWLRLRGEQPPLAIQAGELLDVEVLGTVEAANLPGRPGIRAAMLPLDRGYLSDELLARTLRWLDHSRADLLALTQDLPPATLDSVIISDGESGDQWPIRTILHHLASAEYGYARRVAGPWNLPAASTAEESCDVFEHLRAERSTFKVRLGSIPVAERDRIIYPAWDNRPDDPWTLKKSLRRALEHEREHIQQISALLYQIEQERAPKVGG